MARVLAAIGITVWLVLALATAALAHMGEENVPAFTDVQEGIAILAGQPELMDNAIDKVHDALDSNDQSGVDVTLVKQASAALSRNDASAALLLLERSIGACPGAPVLNPVAPPRSPAPLSSPCPNPQHLEGLSGSAVGGAQETVFLVLAFAMIITGVLLVRRIR
jgi:hypothetical protein